MKARPSVLEFGMAVNVHGRDSTEAACRAVDGGLSVPSADPISAYATITVSVEYPEEPPR